MGVYFVGASSRAEFGAACIWTCPGSPVGGAIRGRELQQRRALDMRILCNYGIFILEENPTDGSTWQRNVQNLEAHFQMFSLFLDHRTGERQ